MFCTFKLKEKLVYLKTMIITCKMILQLMLLLIAVLGSSIYTLIEEESKTGFARGHDKFRFTLLGTLAVSLVLWMSLGDIGS